MAIPYFAGEKLIYMGYIIVSSLQLGATIDYSILLTNTYLDLRKKYNAKESGIRAIANSSLSIFTSGAILTSVGYGLYFISSVGAIADMGHLVGRGALLSTTLVLGMLPPLLIWSDKIIVRKKKLSINNIKKKIFLNFREKTKAENQKTKAENQKTQSDTDENKASIRKGEGNVKK